MKIKQSIYTFFYGAFSCCFGFIILKIFFGDTYHNYHAGILFLYMILGLAILLGAFRLLKKYEKWINKNYPYLLLIFLILYGIIILFTGHALRFTPAFDMDAIYGGAIQWLKDGSFYNYYEYYGYFPNNIGAMTFLHTFFSISSLFGVTDFFSVGLTVNCLLIISTIMVTSLCCKKIYNALSGILALLFFMLCIPFLFMGAAFYTDSLSLLFPVLFYYFYLHFKEQRELKKKIIFAILMGLVLSQGMLIKFTVAIVLIAVIIDALLSLDIKKTCLMTGICIAIVTIVFSIFNTYIYSVHLDKEQSRQLNTPYLHWVMMGLKNNGSYNPEDYEYTRSFSPEERNKACFSRIKERVDTLGLSGMSRLLANKAIICFGDGTYALSDFLDDNPAENQDIHNYILYSGKNYKDYQHLTTGFLLALYSVMVYGAGLCAFRKRRPKDFYFLAPRLSGLGILFFLLLWETSGRYFTNFIPLLIISAVLAITFKEWRK